MEKITVSITERLAQRIRTIAEKRGDSVSDVASMLIRRGYDASSFQGVMNPSRGQREGAKNDPRLQWWREAKFGMFIHWGLYALPAGTWKGQQIPGIGEWIMQRAEIPVKEYEQLAGSFNPVKFNAAQWVTLAKKTGQKYLVITSKHHDGFCLFKSQYTEYTIADGTPFGRDVIKELSDECRRQDLKLGFYYSQTQDWHHPDGDGNDWDFDPIKKDFAGYIEDYVKPHIRELLTNYGPVALIWFDTPKAITKEQSDSLVNLVHELQPDCLASGRIGNALGDYASAGDNAIPEELVLADWETPATLNDTWGFKSYDHNWKSTEDLLHKLVDIASKGGNYLLNVGPTAEGVIPDPSVERLQSMGEWLAKNGESVYGTLPGPLQGQSWCRTTKKSDTLYLHVFSWPEDGRLVVPGIKSKSASLLDSGDELPVTVNNDGTIVSGPSQTPDAIDTVVVLQLEG